MTEACEYFRLPNELVVQTLITSSPSTCTVFISRPPVKKSGSVSRTGNSNGKSAARRRRSHLTPRLSYIVSRGSLQKGSQRCSGERSARHEQESCSQGAAAIGARMMESGYPSISKRGALTAPSFPFPDIVPQPQSTGLNPANAGSNTG